MSAILGRTLGARARERVPPAADGPEATASDTSLTLHRTISIVAATGLFYPLLKAWDVVIQDPAAGLASVALVAGTLWMICALASAEAEADLERLDRWLLVLAILVLAAWGAQALWQTSGYDTDEAAFVHAAANLLVHGHDPYGANLTSSLSQFAVPPSFWTYTMSGGMVSTLGYPALPVLIAVPFIELTSGGQALPIADLILLVVAVVGLFAALPKPWRGLAVIVCVAFPVLFGIASAGDNAVMVIVPLLLVAFRWQSIGASGRLQRMDVARAVALGLAVSCNQIAWFVAPFVVCGVYMARRSDLGGTRAIRVSVRFAAIAVGTFLLVNAPFIVWDPGAWLSGVLAPLTQHALPYGQGLVGVSVYLRLGGGNIDAYSYAAGLLYLALLAWFVMDFGRLARCCFVFPSVALFVSGRSLAVYWTAVVAVIVVSVATAERPREARAPAGAWPRWRGRALPPRLLLPALFAPVVACLALAVGTPAPLSLHILSAHSDPASRSVAQLQLRVSNRSASALTPHFSADARGAASAFWRIVSGPRALPPGASATYVLAATDATAQPPNAAPFVIQAVTSSPRTISSSDRYVQVGPAPQTW